MGRILNNRPLWIAAAGLLAVLVVIGGLQYRWIGQLHDAEADRRDSALAAGIEGFRDELDRTVFGWHVPMIWASTWIAQWPERPLPAKTLAPLADLEVLHRLWREAYLREIDTAGRTSWQRLDRQGDSIAAEPPANVAACLTGSWPGAIQVPIVLDDVVILATPLGPPVEELGPYLAGKPLHYGLATARQLLVVVLDRQRFSEELLKPLARRHLPAWSGGFDYTISTVADPAEGSSAEILFASQPLESGELAEAAAEIRLLGGKSLATVAFGGSLASSGEKPSQPPWCRAAETARADEPEFGLTSLLGVEPTMDCKREFSIFLNASGEGGGWQLRLAARDGSIASAIDRLRTRNLAISLVSLAVLAACLALLGLLIVRAGRLARLQLEFVTGVSHDLRTPLSVINQAAANLADGLVVGEQEVRGYGELVRREGRRLQELIERVLAYAGLADRALPLSAVELPEVVERVMGRLAGEIEQRQVEVENKLLPGLPAVRGNVPALETAIQNLLSNALKYGESGGRVEIDAVVEERGSRREVRLAVRDWGLGIETEDRRRLFEPFYRGRRARESQLPGTGLGLSLVAKVANLLGGRVRVESAVGGGCAFYLHLPVATQEVES